MKLLRWAAAGASVYAIYKYSIGSKAKGDDVLITPARAIANLTQDDTPASDSTAKPAASAEGSKKA